MWRQSKQSFGKVETFWTQTNQSLSLVTSGVADKKATKLSNANALRAKFHLKKTSGELDKEPAHIFVVCETFHVAKHQKL
ncbi:hypothetical protein JOB18_015195 [Solea senegalensis]|uniref:Uncharacterized protein n=1 Tax=Solea senegalensis TaxID=28829 RepID=A0AAV6R4M2_SOLSE|nr:hypothetical protein JOB18_015195 [Solea senegalensis]